MNTERTSRIAQVVQSTFLDIRDKINTQTASEELRNVIKLLPVDEYSKTRGMDAAHRLSRFPFACCSDATYVLAALLHGLNDSCFLEIKEFEIIHAINPEDRRIDHYWLRCDGVSYDVTYGQFDSNYNKKALIGEHPFNDWNIETKPIMDVLLAEYINGNYLRWSDDEEEIVAVKP